MRLRQLRCFAAVIEAGRFSAAATRLRVGQPGLSHQVARLERDLGVKLLVRSKAGVQPTDLGERLYRSARLVLDEVDRIEGELQRTRS